MFATFTTTTAAAAIRAAFGDKEAGRQLAAAAVETAAIRTILHGDAALFRAMQEAIEARKGAASKAMGGRLLAAESAAREAQKAAFPDGRKGKATADQESKASGLAAPIAADFLAALQGDADARSAKAKEAAQARKDAKGAAPEGEKAQAEGEKAQAEGETATGYRSALTLSEFVKAIQAGDAWALQAAQAVRGALNEYEAAQAKARAEAAEAEAARKAAVAVAEAAQKAQKAPKMPRTLAGSRKAKISGSVAVAA